MFRVIKTEPPGPGTPDNPVIIPSDGNENQAVAQDQQDQRATPTPSSSRATEIEYQCPPSWLQVLKPRVEASASSSSQLNATSTGENETQSASSAPDVDSDDEPLIGRRRKGKRAASKHDEETARGPSTTSKRQRHNGGTPHSTLSTPAPASTGPAASSPTPANAAAYNGLRVVVAPPFQCNHTEVRCRGHMTFEQAKGCGGHGGNHIFQWPLGIGNPFFIIVCEPCRHATKDRGYFWTHPIEGSHKAGLKHFGMHMSEWQILEHSGWHVTNAREHFDDLLHHNSTLADQADKQPPKTKPRGRTSAV